MNAQQNQKRPGADPMPKKTPEKTAGVKRSMLDLDKQYSNSQQRRNTSNASDVRKTSTDARSDSKDAIKSSLGMLKSGESSTGRGPFLGQQESNLSKAWKGWLFVNKDSVLESEVVGSTIKLSYEKKSVGEVEGPLMSIICPLCKNDAIVIKVRKLIDRKILIRMYLNQKYKPIEKRQLSLEEKGKYLTISDSFRKLFEQFGYKKTESSFVTQLTNTVRPKNFDDSNSQLVNQTVYDPFRPDNSVKPNKMLEEKKIANSDAMVSEDREAIIEETKSSKESTEKVALEQLITPPPEFASKLEEHQIEGLNWMLAKEGKQSILQKILQRQAPETLHPLFEEWTMKDGTKLYLHARNGQLATTRPIPEIVHGGIIADDEEFDQATTLVALILTNSWKKDSEFLNPGSSESKSNIGTPVKMSNLRPKTSPTPLTMMTFKPQTHFGGTLIICPSINESKWKNEILDQDHKSTLKVLRYKGSQHKNITDHMIRGYDVIIVCYSYLQYMNLKRIHWHRIILDEPQYIKSSPAQTSMLVFGLEAKNRWVLSRTATQNKLDNIYDALKFLKADPWGFEPWGLGKSEWEKLISQAHASPELLHSVLRPIMLRRPKVRIQFITLEKSERDEYEKTKREVVSEIKAHYDPKDSKKKFESMKNEFYLAKWTQRLKQVCDHEFFVESNKRLKNLLESGVVEKLKDFLNARGIELDGPQSELPEVQDGISIKCLQEKIASLVNNEVEDCAICFEKPENVAFTKCSHVYCKQCLLDALSMKNTCPNCRQYLERWDFVSFERMALDFRLENMKPSSKVSAVMEKVLSIAKRNEKGICFTQWTAMMNILSYEMEKYGVKCVKIDEDCSPHQKSQLLKEFSENPKITILVADMTLTGVRLDFPNVKDVLIVDPFPGVEEQAIGLVHKPGSGKLVYVTKFVCKDTIEEKIVSLTDSKKKNLTPKQIFEYILGVKR